MNKYTFFYFNDIINLSLNIGEGIMCKSLLQKIKERRKDDFPNITYKYKRGGVYYDKVEKTWAYRKCIKKAEKLAYQMADEETNGYRGRGYCHTFWDCKQKVLKEKYNIDWRTPSQMNPRCRFD